ncbi:MAG: DNA-protecting protein DprA [Flavobacteriales bacterium]|nr:DNA-protecting protein DprA [Flavobacteriales bacterium]
MTESTLLYQLALSQIPMVGSVLAKNLVGYCGSVEAIFSESLNGLKKIPGIGEAIAKSVYNFKDFEPLQKEVEFISRHHIKTHFFTEKTYPYKLKQIADAPILLFQKGDFADFENRSLAIVGTRKCSAFGRDITHQIVADLKTYNPTIYSGLAYGVDAFAHKAAVNNNLKTIGVLAHGLDRIYPATHSNLANEMIENGGALITEYKSETNPDRENFPTRNRIVAGLVDAVLVVETAIKGGSMITANLAFGYDRDVFAIPNRPGDDKTAGCNYLIKNNKATLVESAADIAFALGWDIETKKTTKQTTLFVELTTDEQIIVDSLKTNGVLSIDSLSNRTDFSASKLAFLLLELEFKNVVRNLPGKQFELA